MEIIVIISLLVIVLLTLVILNIIIGSENEYFKSNEFINSHRPRKAHARKIDTSFSQNDNLKDNLNNNIQKRDSNKITQENPDQLPLYEEEVILVNNPEDPENPIKKRILKRIDSDKNSDDDFQDIYIVDELK